MNTQNTIEKIFLKKKDKNLPDPEANSQVYILNLSHRFGNALFCCWTKPFCERGVTRQCVHAVVYIACRSLIMAWRARAAALQHFLLLAWCLYPLVEVCGVPLTGR